MFPHDYPQDPDLLRGSAHGLLCYAAIMVPSDAALAGRLVERAAELIAHAWNIEREERRGSN